MVLVCTSAGNCMSGPVVGSQVLMAHENASQQHPNDHASPKAPLKLKAPSKGEASIASELVGPEAQVLTIEILTLEHQKADPGKEPLSPNPECEIRKPKP